MNMMQEWSDTHDGIPWAIRSWKHPQPEEQDMGNAAWAFYLYIHIDRIPEESNPESFWLPPCTSESGRIYYSYSNHEILRAMDWHQGITWYSKDFGFDGQPRVIKVGCDYQHYHDEGHCRGLEEVRSDAINAIASFRNLVPGYKYWCPHDGKLHLPSEITKTEGGRYKCGCSNISSSKSQGDI